MNKSGGQLVVIACGVCALAVLLVLTVVDARNDLTKSRLERVARSACKMQGREVEADLWGTMPRIDYEFDGSYRECTATSAGPDRMFGTDDDLQAVIRYLLPLHSLGR